MSRVHILAPTLLEYLAVRRMLPTATRAYATRGAGAHATQGAYCIRPYWSGMRLARWRGAPAGSVVVVCGLAGALTPNLRPGAIVVPEWIGLSDGRSVRCDRALVLALVEAACASGFEPDTGPLLTACSLVVGAARQEWAQRGFVAADLETGLLAERGLRVATIRVVLDSPQRDISQRWTRPADALLRPALWPELAWLGWAAPRYALRAAGVLKAGIERFVAGEVN